MSHSRQNTRPDLAPHCLNTGDVLDERYRIERVIGEGTFAWVYLARHATIDSLQCAIKVLKPHFVGDEAMMEQFYQEAETIARLRDRHTVRVSDMGTLPDGRPYICMEYSVGATLDRIIAQSEGLSDVMVAHIARGVLRSLREAHGLGIVHRDIKPSNIILTEDTDGDAPLARVLDFGIAYVTKFQPGRATDDNSELVFCTPSYASPEVLRGEVTEAADIYALGLTLAELIEGRPVFPNTGFYSVAARQMADEPVPFGPKTLASKLLPILQTACEKDRSLRFGSADAMLEALDALSEALDGEALEPWSQFIPAPGTELLRHAPSADRLHTNMPTVGFATHTPKPGALVPDSDILAPLSSTDFEDFGALQQALDQGAAFERVGEDTDSEPEAPALPGGTVRTTRMALKRLGKQPNGSDDASKDRHASRLSLERYRLQLLRQLEAAVPPKTLRAMRLIANASLGLLLLSLLVLVLLRGLPG